MNLIRFLAVTCTSLPVSDLRDELLIPVANEYIHCAHRIACYLGVLCSPLMNPTSQRHDASPEHFASLARYHEGKFPCFVDGRNIVDRDISRHNVMHPGFCLAVTAGIATKHH